LQEENPKVSKFMEIKKSDMVNLAKKVQTIVKKPKKMKNGDEYHEIYTYPSVANKLYKFLKRMDKV